MHVFCVEAQSFSRSFVPADTAHTAIASRHQNNLLHTSGEVATSASSPPRQPWMAAASPVMSAAKSCQVTVANTLSLRPGLFRSAFVHCLGLTLIVSVVLPCASILRLEPFHGRIFLPEHKLTPEGHLFHQPCAPLRPEACKFARRPPLQGCTLVLGLHCDWCASTSARSHAALKWEDVHRLVSLTMQLDATTPWRRVSNALNVRTRNLEHRLSATSGGLVYSIAHAHRNRLAVCKLHRSFSTPHLEASA